MKVSFLCVICVKKGKSGPTKKKRSRFLFLKVKVIVNGEETYNNKSIFTGLQLCKVKKNLLLHVKMNLLKILLTYFSANFSTMREIALFKLMYKSFDLYILSNTFQQNKYWLSSSIGANTFSAQYKIVQTNRHFWN